MNDSQRVNIRGGHNGHSFDGHLSQQRSEGRRLVYDLYLCFEPFYRQNRKICCLIHCQADPIASCSAEERYVAYLATVQTSVNSCVAKCKSDIGILRGIHRSPSGVLHPPPCCRPLFASLSFFFRAPGTMFFFCATSCQALVQRILYKRANTVRTHSLLRISLTSKTSVVQAPCGDSVV